MNKVKNIRFSMHEALPFRVKYHEEDGESVCTVKQDDLEGLYKAFRNSNKIGYLLLAMLLFVTAGFTYTTYTLVNQPPATKVVLVDKGSLIAEGNQTKLE